MSIMSATATKLTSPALILLDANVRLPRKLGKPRGTSTDDSLLQRVAGRPWDSAVVLIRISNLVAFIASLLQHFLRVHWDLASVGDALAQHLCLGNAAREEPRVVATSLVRLTAFHPAQQRESAFTRDVVKNTFLRGS
jgi:CO/xanthine dehydrogenase FAD-binding subunit